MGRARDFVLIDTETTGFAFNRNDRVIEIGAVKYDSDFNEIGRFETLLNPERDLGPQHIHGVDSAWVLDAPRFSEIASDLLAFLNNSLIVGHNVDFDLRFLEAEFTRCGFGELSLTAHGICTKRLARAIGVDTPSFSLESLCSQFGIENGRAHAALDDAIATGKVLQQLLTMDGAAEDYLRHCRQFSIVVDFQNQDRQFLKPRPRIPTEYAEGFVARLVKDLPISNESTSDVDEYSVYLCRALSDLQLSEDEITALVELAAAIGLSVSEVAAVHADYLNAMFHKAWADDVMTDFERDEIVFIAKQLGISEFDLELGLSGKAHRPSRADSLFESGEIVVLTGTMTPPKAEVAKIVEKMGGVIADSLTKKTKLLIAADANTLSNKGQAARKWGIRVISTATFISINSSSS